MSAGVSLHVGTGETDAVSFHVPGGQFAGVDGLVHASGVDTEHLRGFAHAQQITFTTHSNSMYVIRGR